MTAPLPTVHLPFPGDRNPAERVLEWCAGAHDHHDGPEVRGGGDVGGGEGGKGGGK